MSTAILPPSATTGTAPAAPAGHSAMLATVADAPPAAARLDPGNIITGTVLGRDSRGHVTLRTDKGVLTLQTAANLPVGSTVALEVRVAGTRLQVVVLSVEPPPGGAAQPWTGGASGAAPSGPAGPAPAAPANPAAILAALTGGSPVMATVVHATQPAPVALPGAVPGAPLQPPAPAAGPQPAGAPPVTLPAMAAPAIATPGAPSPQGAGTTPLPGLAPFAPGPVSPAPLAPAPFMPAPTNAAPSMAAAGPLSQGAPAAHPAGLTPDLTGAALPPLLPSAAVPLAQTPAGQPPLPAQPAPLPVGVEIGLRIVGAALPGNPAPVAPTRPQGAPPLTTGLVIADTPAGHPVIDTPAGRMVLAVKAALPPGTLLLLELPAPAGLPPLANATTSATQDPAAMLRLARGWPALADVLAALDEIDHPAGAELAARLPQAGPRLAAGLLTLMAQLMAGNVGEWLPPAIREALERAGKRDLVDRLRGEFQQLARLAGEPAGGEWRVMFLPLLNGQELQQINLYLRGKRRGRDGEALDTGTRFVVEVDMTRLGPLQLDGLVHGRRFDLMLRSRKLLSPAMRRDIEAIFDEARAIGGYAGTIGFQVAASFPVAPLDQAKRKSAAGGVVV